MSALLRWLLVLFRSRPINEVGGHVFPHPSDPGWTRTHRDFYTNGHVEVVPGVWLRYKDVDVPFSPRVWRYTRAVGKVQRELLFADLERTP